MSDVSALAGSKERSKAQRRGKAQLLAGRLLRGTRKGKQIALSEHEMEVAADVVRGGHWLQVQHSLWNLPAFTTILPDCSTPQ
eukprot:3328951-Pleurochrysis_carterae.AAC.2